MLSRTTRSGSTTCRRRTEHHAVDETHHGGVGADAERQREGDGEGEAGLPGEGAERVAQVLAQPGEAIAPAGALLAGAIDTDELIARGSEIAEASLGFGPRVGFAHARGAQVGDGLLEMKAELVVDLGRDVSRALVEPEEPAKRADHAVASSTRETARE